MTNIAQTINGTAIYPDGSDESLTIHGFVDWLRYGTRRINRMELPYINNITSLQIAEQHGITNEKLIEELWRTAGKILEDPQVRQAYESQPLWPQGGTYQGQAAYWANADYYRKLGLD